MEREKSRSSRMQGMTRAQIDKAESKDFAIGKGPLRPRDAGTLILLDHRGGVPHVLVGRRHTDHAFMPGKFVFPGGRTDPADARIVSADELDPFVVKKLMSGPGRKASAARARAIALSAIRETYEEAGYLIGDKGSFNTSASGWRGFADQGVIPALSGLRYIARAVTPPGRVRRFDTRFMAAFSSSVAVVLEDGGPTHELDELVWLPIREAMQVDVPVITKTILEELDRRLEQDPDLNPTGDIPFYHMRYNRFRRDTI